MDEDGNTAISTTTIGSNWLGKTGIRLMASVEWSGNDNTNIEVAQGHNSAFVDEDGTAMWSTTPASPTEAKSTKYVFVNC